MAHFKLDPSYLIKRVEFIMASKTGQPERDEVEQDIFLSEVLPVMIYHVDQQHQALHQLIREHPWLDFVRVVKHDREDPGALNIETLYQEIEETKTKTAVESLREAPLRLSLVLADFVRLYRCLLVTEKLDVMRPEFYILGKSDQNYRSNESHTVRAGVPDLDMEKYIAEIRYDETGAETNPEKKIHAWCKNLFCGIGTSWPWAPYHEDRIKNGSFRKLVCTMEQKFSASIQLNETAKKSPAIYKSAWWHYVLSIGLDIMEYERLQKEVLLCYKTDLARLPRWNIFKNQIRTICLSLGSPHPHDEPLDNISELRLHLSYHNDLYETIQKLNDKIGIQQRIITNLSFRHLLEHLAPNDGKQSEAERWHKFWKKACEKAVSDKKDPPLKGETNAERKAKRDAGREKGGKKMSKSSDESLKNQNPKGGAKSDATSSSEIRLDGLEVKESQESELLEDANLKLRLAQNIEPEPAAEPSNKAKETKGKSLDLKEEKTGGEEKPLKKMTQDLGIMSQRYEISPLVEVLEKCPPPYRDPPASSDEVIRPIGGAQLYRILSQNIHGFEQEEDAYMVKQSQWNNIEFQILRALKPRLDENGRVDWRKERARFVSEF